MEPVPNPTEEHFGSATVLRMMKVGPATAASASPGRKGRRKTNDRNMANLKRCALNLKVVV